MPKDLALFNFGAKEVRVVTREGEPWFVAKDVADILGFQGAYYLNRLLDEDERGCPHIVGAPSKNQYGTFELQVSLDLISESGLYHAIFSSRVEQAKAFRKWVTAEVLPSLRKTGTYAQDRWVDFAEYCSLVRKTINPRSKTLTEVPHSVRHALIIARADPHMGGAMIFGGKGELWVREDRLATAKDGQVERRHFEAVDGYRVEEKAAVLGRLGRGVFNMLQAIGFKEAPHG